MSIHLAIATADVPINGQVFCIHVDRSVATCTNDAAIFIGRAIQNRCIRIEIDRIPFIGLQNRYSKILFSPSGMCFEITDAMICSTYIYL